MASSGFTEPDTNPTVVVTLSKCILIALFVGGSAVTAASAGDRQTQTGRPWVVFSNNECSNVEQLIRRAVSH